MNVLITGGTGFIGSKLVEYLLEKGCNIIILTRDKAKVSAGIEAVSDIKEIKSSEKIDVIVNLAGAPISKRWSEI
jgi:NAD dependent epimerase/dehydratase family enzyme